MPEIKGAAPQQIAVIVTGAARGIGRAMTLALARAGLRVAAADLPSSREPMDELLRLARQHGTHERIVPIDCDVTRFEDCAAAVQAATARFGAVHGLVNNAGIRAPESDMAEGARRRKFYEHKADSYRRVVETNVVGPFNMAKAIAPSLIAQGWGRIVNITTSHPTMVAEAFSPYGATKAALEAATVIWAKDLAGTGVTVNALLPGGAANTRMVPDEEVPDRSTLVSPDVMAAPIVWLMSARSDGVTGRRFIGRQWDAALDGTAAAQKAGTPAGWPT